LLGVSILLKWLLFIEYFYVLLLGYIFPTLFFLEYVFIPAILMGFATLYPKRVAMAIVIASGIFGSIYFSSNYIRTRLVIIEGIDIPVSLISAWYYLSVVFLVLILIRLNSQLKSIEIDMQRVLAQNRRIDMVNRNISDRLFRIKQDSSIAERMRIVKEIHDTVGYIFVNIIMLLQASLAIIRKDRESAETKINDALDYTRRGTNEIRYILREMRAYEHPSMGLQNEMHEIGNLFSRATGVEVSLSYGNWKKSYGKELDGFFKSFLQESFTNALKHGCSTKVNMNCWETSSRIIITVQDNGSGAPLSLRYGIGLQSIQDSVQAYGGEMDLVHGPVGFGIRIAIPHKPESKKPLENDGQPI